MLTFALFSDILLIPDKDEHTICAIKLAQLEDLWVNSLSEVPQHCAFELPQLCAGWVVERFGFQYNPQTRSHPPGVPPVPFRISPDSGFLITLTVEMKDPNPGSARGAENSIQYCIDSNKILGYVLSAPAQATVHKFSWNAWGPQSCSFDVISGADSWLDNWPRSIYWNRMLEFNEGNSLSFADFNPLKFRKSLATQGSIAETDYSRQYGFYLNNPDHLSKSVYKGFSSPFSVTLPCRSGIFPVKHEDGEVWQGTLICEDAVIIPQKMVRFSYTSFVESYPV